MKKFILISLLLILPFALFAQPALWGEKLIRATVAVVDGEEGYYQSFGTGTIVDVRGYIVTAAHVVNQKGPTRIFYGDGSGEISATVLFKNQEFDIAVLKVDPGERQLEVIRFADQAPNLGSAVYALGHPQGIGWTLTKGIICSTRYDPKSGIEYYQFDAYADHGSSGGGLYDAYGYYIGMVQFGAAGTGLALSGEFVQIVVQAVMKIHQKCQRGLDILANYTAESEEVSNQREERLK